MKKMSMYGFQILSYIKNYLFEMDREREREREERKPAFHEGGNHSIS